MKDFSWKIFAIKTIIFSLWGLSTLPFLSIIVQYIDSITGFSSGNGYHTNHMDYIFESPLVYMGVVCTAFTNILWNKSLSLLPANTCSAFYPIQTLTSSFLGVVVFHDVLTTSFVLGSAFIIVGVLISLLFKKRTRKEKEVLV